MSLARNSLYNLAPSVLQIAVGLVTVPLYIAQIGPDRYGALAIAWLLLGYFGQADFGIGRAVTQHISATRSAGGDQRAETVWSAFAIMTVFGLAGGALTFAAGYFFFSGPLKVDDAMRGELLASLWLLALANPVISLFGVASGSLMGLERFRLVSAGNLVSSSALQILPLLAAFLLGNDLRYLIGASLLARVIGFAMLAAGVWHAILRRRPVRVSRKRMVQLTGFGKWVMVSALVGPLMILSDRFAIGALLGTAAVAAYTIPFQMASRTMIFPVAVVQALFPRFAAEEAADSSRRCSDYTAFIALCFAPLIIGLICLADPLLKLWLGRNLDPASILIGQIILAGFWINGAANIPYAFIQARGNPRFTALLHVAELPFYFLLLFGLGSLFGVAGMAAAFSIRCAIDCAALIVKGRAYTRPMLGWITASGALILIAIALHPVLDGWGPALLAAAVLGALSTALLFRGMPDEIRQKIALALRHGRARFG